MREEDSNWFARWEQELPSPEELMPLSQTLITPDLARAFDIRTPNHVNGVSIHSQQPQTSPNPQTNSSADFPADSTDLGSGAAGDESARTLKRPRLVWTPQLHKRFIDAVAHLGIKNAVPKTIMQMMSVDGLTRENVASHLQKYRLYIKRIENLSNGGGGGKSGGVGSDSATDRLFASTPVPAHFLHQTRGTLPLGSDHLVPSFVPMTTLQQQPRLVPATVIASPYLQPPPYNQIQMASFGSPTNGKFGSQTIGQLDYSFLARQNYQAVNRMGNAVTQHNPAAGYIDDLESANSSGEGKVLDLFPTRDD